MLEFDTGLAILDGSIGEAIASDGAGALPAAAGVIGGLGTILQGAGDVACGVTGQENFCQGAQAASNATNPAGLIILVSTGGDQDLASVATAAFSIANLAISNTPADQTNAILSVSDAVSTLIGNRLPPTIVTSPPTYENVDGGQAPSVPYVQSSYSDSGPLVYSGGQSGGGGESHDLSSQDEDDYDGDF